MNPPIPPPRNPSCHPTSMPPPPPPSPSPAPQSSADARPDASLDEAEGSSKPSPSSSMPPPSRNPSSHPSSSMPPPPLPKSSPPPQSAVDARLDASLDEADGSTKPCPSSSMPPPPPPKPSKQQEAEPASEPGSAEGSTDPIHTVNDSSSDEAGTPRDTEMGEAAPPEQRQQKPRAPYAIPDWSTAPDHPFFLEVLKDGIISDKLDVSKKGAYMFGRIDLCDFVLEHPTISRFHAVLQFRNDGEVFLYDLGSTHGSSINKTQIKKKMYMKINVGDVVRFGQSSRLYIFQGPSELMPPEKDMQKLRDSKIRQDILDREASLSRAKTQAALAEGISWGMDEDAIEESIEDEADEITWQTYNGQLTDRQEKTRSKIIKRMEKVANMKKEIDAIRVKDISQGGLTQGQQTQIARNEQRMSQIMEELENLEETLNDSIQESLGARAGKPKRSSRKASLEEEDEVFSDDDEFFDRTKKKSSGNQPSGQQSVETADSLLEKKNSITNDMEGKKKMLEEEKKKLVQKDNADLEDDLDAYMSGLSSQLVNDNISEIQKELVDLQAELDKVVYLLKVADPMGEATRKRDLMSKEGNTPASNENARQESPKEGKIAQNRTAAEEKLKDSCSSKTQGGKSEVDKDVSENQENGSKPAFTIPKPQWLGDKRIIEPEENCIKEGNINAEETDNFVDYKDRKTVLSSSANEKDLEEAAPGLILRKRKSADQAGTEAESSSVESEASIVDAVALLLKHKRGLQTSENMDDENEPHASKRKGKKSKQKRVLGPARPDFLEAGPDYESWVPPEGQTGDGRTSLNERLGY